MSAWVEWLLAPPAADSLKAMPAPASEQEIAETLEAFSLGGPENAIGFVIWRMTHRFQRLADRILLPLDLTYLQFVTLGLSARLRLNTPLLVQADIARFSGIHPMQVSAVLKALEGKKMVTRTAARGAAKDVRITKQGLVALSSAMPSIQALQRELFGSEGAPKGDLLESLRKLDKQQATKD